MPGSSTTLLIEGTFEELAEELAQYIDDVQHKQNPNASSIKSDVTPLISQGKKTDVLKKLVTSSAALNAAPEREFIAAYNLLVHLVLQSDKPEMFLNKMTQNLSSPITSSPQNGPALALTVLTTIFNILPEDSDIRYHIFLEILKLVRQTNNFDVLRPQLENLDTWIQLWETDAEDQQALYLRICDAAAAAHDPTESYAFLLRALRTIPSSDAASSNSKSLALRALKAALSHPTHFTFQDLTDLDAVQALRKSEPDYFELLELFNAELLDDYNDFLDSHDNFLEESGLDNSILMRKIRLLTLASLAASTPSRSLPYQQIARALQIPAEDVEMWVIDVIRAGLVEGKLSQLNSTFLIQRSTYRVFGEKQWTEVQGRLDTWRTSLEGVLAVIKREKVKMLNEKEKEAKEIEGKFSGGMGQGRGRAAVTNGFDD